jgi:hypothetical protein
VVVADGKPLQCHRCRSASLLLRETRYEHAEYDGGLFVDDDMIRACGDGIFTPGEIQPKLTVIECQDCGHAWHPRRGFDGGGW